MDEEITCHICGKIYLLQYGINARNCDEVVSRTNCDCRVKKNRVKAFDKALADIDKLIQRRKYETNFASNRKSSKSI
jgi:hypothetical protein